MAYSEQVIDQLQALNDIVEVITSYIPLKRVGRSFKACCPFHQEKTPSFMVHAEKQIYHCFGCGVGGDVFSFVMKYEQLNFPEAVKRLAERVHFALPEESRFVKQERSETDRLYQMYAAAAGFYAANLKHPETGKTARAYLEKRGFGAAEIDSFQIGYALSDWKKLFEFLTVKSKFSEQELLKSGLVLRSSQGTCYDMFRNRVMFPVSNAQGKVIAFGGRTMGEDTPKYINSPETAIFSKRREMYALNLAKKAMAAQEDGRTAMIVEGYLDCIRLHANGFTNAVATLGTALTPDHVRILKRYADEAIVIFDGDQAGEQASLRGLDTFLEGGMSVKAVCLPRGFDPDDLIQAKGRDAMTQLIEARQDFFDFKLEHLLKRYNKSDSLGLLRITSEFLDTFARIQSPVLVDRYLKKLAATLGVEESSLRTELAKLKAKQRPAPDPAAKKTAPPPLPKPKEPVLEVHLLGLLLQDAAFLDRFRDSFPDYSFSGAMTREAFRIIEETVRSGAEKKMFASKILNRTHNEELKAFISQLLVIGGSMEDREQTFQECLRKLEADGRALRLQALRSQISQAEELGDEHALQELMKAYQQLLVEQN